MTGCATPPPPPASTPQVQTPGVQVQAPGVQVQLPEVQVQAPQVQLPQVQLPQVQLPQVQLPQVKAPGVQVQMPEVQVQLPQVQLPQVQLPQVQMQMPQALPPARAVVSIGAAENLNPNPGGRASPLQVRLFELKTLGAFGKADFFSLYEQPSATLGADLVAQEEFVLRPGETRFLERLLNPETRHIGLFAAYRDLDRAVWRTSVPVIANRTNPIRVDLEARTIIARLPEN